MDNFYLKRIDWAEIFPGSTATVLQAIDQTSEELLAEIVLTRDEFWSLPGDEFDVDDTSDEILERLFDAYMEHAGE